LRKHRQVSAPGQVLAQQAVGVPVGAAPPWRMRIGEVNAQTRERGRFPVSRHLPASIIGQSEAERCFYRKQTGGEAGARSPAHPSRPCTADRSRPGLPL
jgi:hypothetical protein